MFHKSGILCIVVVTWYVNKGRPHMIIVIIDTKSVCVVDLVEYFKINKFVKIKFAIY